MPNLYIIAGCNGAGKTTASYTILPEILNCREFVNADEIAKGISPFQPEKVSIEAGRIMLLRINELIRSRVDFAFETTLSTKSYQNLVLEAKQKNYRVVLVFFWLNSPELAKERVRNRVRSGGHNIPDEVVERRYARGLRNLFAFARLSDYWMVWNNSEGESQLICDGNLNLAINVYNHDIWEVIKRYGTGGNDSVT